MAKKATKAQNLQRMRVVYEMLLSDTPRPDVLQYAAKNWGIATRTTDMLIRKANNLIIEEANRMRENTLEKHLAQRALIRHKALKDGDKRLAFDVLKDETKLLGLYAPTKLEHTGPEGGPVQTVGYTVEEWRKEQDRRLVEVSEMMTGFEEAKSDKDATD